MEASFSTALQSKVHPVIIIIIISGRLLQIFGAAQLKRNLQDLICFFCEKGLEAACPFIL